MARGTPLKWIQAQGGWTTAKLLLDVYGHFLPSEYTGYTDALSRPLSAPYTHPDRRSPADGQGDGAASSTRGTGFRTSAFVHHPQIPDHALYRPAALLEELADVGGDRGVTPRSRTRSSRRSRDTFGQDEVGLAALGVVAEGVRCVALRRPLHRAVADVSPKCSLQLVAVPSGFDRTLVDEQPPATGPEGTERGVSVIMGLQGEADLRGSVAVDRRSL